MSGIVNKVKEALHSAHDTPTEERSGKLNLTPEERARLEAAGYGPEHHANKRHLGATEDITQSGGHPPSYYLDQDNKAASNIPGSFPESQAENIGGQHKDGREYVAPQGTHVGSTTTSSAHQPATDRSLNDPTQHNTSSNIVGGSNTAGTHTTPRETDTSTSTTTAAEAAAAGGLGAGAGAYAAHETKSGPNKLHKKEDPRGHVAFNDPPSHEAIHGSQPATTASTTAATTSRQVTDPATSAEPTTAVHHSLGGTHQTPSTQQSGDVYEQQASRKYDGNLDSSTNTTNYSYPTGTATGTAAAVGAGGAAGLAASQLPERQHHTDERGAIDRQNAPIQSHSAITNPSTTASTSISSPPRGAGVYNTVTGAGSQDDPTHIHPHGTSTTTATTSKDQTFDSHPGLTTGSSAVPRGAGDPTITSTSGSGSGSNYGSTATGNNTNTTPLPSTLTAGGVATSGTNTSTSTAVPGATYSTSGNPSTSTSTSTPSDQHHYGPGHTGSKVVHTCTKCGEDNDITHYFRKETVYRLSQ